MDNMDEEKKDGVSVQQIENFGKRFHIEIFFTIIFILASFFSMVLYSHGWSIFGLGVGGVVGVWIPKHIGKIAHATFGFCHRQQKVTVIVIAVVGVILSIFLPPLIFICAGLMAGRSFHRHAHEAGHNSPSEGNDPNHKNHM